MTDTPLPLISVAIEVVPEYLWCDHITGKHYIAQNPGCPADHVIAGRAVTTTERTWLGRHPDGIVTATTPDAPITSATVEVEISEWWQS